MLKKFALWFICFGLSFLVQNWGWTDQGRAFLYINLGFSFIIVIVVLSIIIIAGLQDGYAGEASGLTFLVIVMMLVSVFITLLATWGATKLFDVDFYIAFQIMTFGQCLCPSKNKKKDD